MAELALPERGAGSQQRWDTIHYPQNRIVIDQETVLLPRGDIEPLLDIAPFGYRNVAPPERILDGLPHLSASLGRVVADLARRFAMLMQCETVRVRVEGITGNACRKVHADFTDVRLICTLVGPGTDYTLGDDPDAPLRRIPTGVVALFKGRAYGPGHDSCLHRSPPIEETGERRLVLVIDTPARHAEA